MKLVYGQKCVVDVFDTLRTRTSDRSVLDTVSEAFYWIGNDTLSGYVGGDKFPSLNTPEKLEKKNAVQDFKYLFSFTLNFR